MDGRQQRRLTKLYLRPFSFSINSLNTENAPIKIIFKPQEERRGEKTKVPCTVLVVQTNVPLWLQVRILSQYMFDKIWFLVASLQRLYIGRTWKMQDPCAAANIARSAIVSTVSCQSTDMYNYALNLSRPEIALMRLTIALKVTIGDRWPILLTAALCRYSQQTILRKEIVVFRTWAVHDYLSTVVLGQFVHKKRSLSTTWRLLHHLRLQPFKK